MKFSIVVAVDSKLGIGKNNALPWRLPGDLKFFKKITTHVQTGKRNAVIMGRKTWDSLPDRFKPLPDRLNIILTRQTNLTFPQDCKVAGSLAESLSMCGENEISEVFVIGGAEIFAEALRNDNLKRVYLTEIHKDFECDCFFPDYHEKLVLQSESDTQHENDVYYCFKILEPKNVAQN